MSVSRIVCAFDPLCGWCFGFRPALRSLVSELLARGNVELSIASSGLIPPEEAVPLAKMRDFLTKGMTLVERRTQVRFGGEFKEGLLAEGTWVANSEPGCRAMFCAEQLAGTKVFEFADALIGALYEEGEPQDDERTIVMCAEDAGIDPGELVSAWKSEAAKVATRAAFAMWKQRGIRVYPGIYVERKGALERIFEGYVDPDVAVSRTLAALDAG